jgi:hypothetical protein
MRALILKQAGWAALCALIVSGCASTNPAPPPPSPAAVTTAETKPVASSDSGGDQASRTSHGSAGEETDAGSSFDNLEIVGAGLNGKLAILRVGSQLAENNLLSVFAGLKNKTPHRLALEMETIYHDKSGDALNVGSWIPVTLKPHEEQEYRSASISEEAVDFLIRVRRAPDTSAHG